MVVDYQNGYGDSMKLNNTNLNKILSGLKETKYFIKNPSQHDPAWKDQFWSCRNTVKLETALNNQRAARRYNITNRPTELHIDLETNSSSWYVFKFKNMADKHKFEAEYLAAPKYMPKYTYG